MDLRRQLGVLRSWFWMLVASVLLAGGAAYLVSSNLPKVYEAQVTLIVGQSLQSSNTDYTQLLASQRLSQTYAELATTSPILQEVIDSLSLGVTTAEFQARIRSSAPRDSTLITITAQDGDPALAARIANAVAAELRAASPAISGRNTEVQQFIDKDLEATQGQIAATQLEVQRLAGLTFRTADQEKQLETLQARLITLRQTYATLLGFSSNSGNNLLTVVDPASPPAQAAAPRILLNTLLAAMLGLVLAVGIAFLFEFLDDTLKTSDDVAAVTGLPTLGAIVRMKGDEARKKIYRLAVLLYPRSPAAEAYRALRTNIEFASVDGPVKVILVTSSIPGEGKTTTAGNLAAVFAQAGKRTVLLDADLRKPNVHRLFDLDNKVGLTSLLRSDDVSWAQVAQTTDEENLRVITTGPLPPNPAELLGSHRMQTILDKLKKVADLIVIDSPPLQAVTDAAILSKLADGTVFVIDAGHTRRAAIKSGYATLSKSGAHILGAVLNRLTARSGGQYYYYDYYGGSKDQGRDASKAPRASGLPQRGEVTGLQEPDAPGPRAEPA